MENVKDEELIIEGNSCSWELNLIGDILGSYYGTFKFRCYLTPTQRLAASREYRALLGDNATTALQREDDMAFALSQLKYRIISAPPFWTATAQTSNIGGDIPDDNIIMAVLDAAIAAEVKYRDHVKKKKADVLERARKAAEKVLNQQDEAEDDDTGES